MKNRKLIIHIAIIVVYTILIGAVAMALSGYVLPQQTGTEPVTTQIDWALQGILISRDGEIKGTETIQFTVKGETVAYSDQSDWVKLDITLPDAFPYSFPNEESYISLSGRYDDMTYFVCPGFCYDKQSNAPASTYFALCPEKEFIIMNWNHDFEVYLVASRDPNTSPQEILEYFREFLDIYSYE